MGNSVSKTMQRWMGIKEETVFNVNEIPDFLDVGEPKCNIIFANDSNVPKPTVNNLDFSIDKTLNGVAEPSPEDVKNGRSNWNFTFGGSVKTNHFGFVEQMFRQEGTYVVDKMIYKFQPICATKSYTMWVPAGCASEEVGYFLTGVRPLTLTKNILEGTYTCEVVVATNHQDPTVNEMPVLANGDYYEDQILANNFSMNTGKFTLVTVPQKTQALEETITYEYADDVGFYLDGVEIDYQVINRTIETSYTSTYGKAATANNQTYTYWRESLTNTNKTDLGYEMLAGVGNTQTASFQAILSEKDLDTTGDLWNFTGKFTTTKSLGDATKDHTLEIVDDLGDISLIF
jgi:hypothetical protein